MKFSKTNLISMFLIAFIILSGSFAFQWWQVKGELGKQIEQNENLMKQIEELQKEIEDLKTSRPIRDETIEDKKAEVTITTDKIEYRQGEEVQIVTKNNSEKTFVITLPVGLEIQRYEDGKWIYVRGVPFLGCPCGRLCEIRLPTFIGSGKVVDTEWNQSIIWCENDLEKRMKILGKYRFELRYIEDKAKCSDAINPLSCFIEQGGIKPEEWKFTYSNEFTIK